MRAEAESVYFGHGEAGLLQCPLRVAIEMTAADQQSPHGCDDVLQPCDPAAYGADVFVEAQLASGARDAVDFGERVCGVATEHSTSESTTASA